MHNNQKINELLTKLQMEYQAVAVKTELSSEFISDEDFYWLKTSAENSLLSLTVKTAGSEDEIGIYKAVELGAENIVVPMVESVYAVEKFVRLVRKQSPDIGILLNIETITGYKNSDEILKAFSQNIKGIVFGRSDFCSSLGFTCKDVDNDLILDYAKKLSCKVREFNKEFFIGGRVSVNSIPFFKKIPYLTGFETRKIIFKSDVLLHNPQEAINKALEFEMLWLNSKTQNKFDLERIEIIKRRL